MSLADWIWAGVTAGSLVQGLPAKTKYAMCNQFELSIFHSIIE